jgi:hypothetical protein
MALMAHATGLKSGMNVPKTRKSFASITMFGLMAIQANRSVLAISLSGNETRITIFWNWRF